MEVGDAAIEGDERGVVLSRQGHEVGVGHLAVADHAAERDVSVREVVWPELVAWAFVHRSQDSPRLRDVESIAEEVPHQASLGDRACRERLIGSRQPPPCILVVHVPLDSQGDQHVGVEERGQSSSSSAFTSSEVMVLPPP